MDIFVQLNYSAQDITTVETIVRKNDSFIAHMTEDVYSIKNYILRIEPLDIYAILDRNFYTRIAALVDGIVPRAGDINDYRWAAAVLAFCQIAGINFDYASSLQEYASSQGGEAAIKQMHALHIANNADPKIFVDFACGRLNQITPDLISDVEPMLSAPAAEDLEGPISEFSVHYLHILKLFQLEREQISNKRKMIRLIDWMEDELNFVAPVFILAFLMFSPTAMKTIVDGRSQKSAKRAAWDLAFILNWRRHLESDNRPIYAITRDRGIKKLMSWFIVDDEVEGQKNLTAVWGKDRHIAESISRHYEARLDAVRKLGAARRVPSMEEVGKMCINLENQLWGKKQKGSVNKS